MSIFFVFIANIHHRPFPRALSVLHLVKSGLCKVLHLALFCLKCQDGAVDGNINQTRFVFVIDMLCLALENKNNVSTCWHTAP